MDESIDAVIWPETALDIFTHAQTSRLKDIPAALPAGTTYAIFGVNRPGDLGKMHNSVISMDRNGTTIDTHDKFILAPWGESIPYPEIVKRTPLYRMVDESSVMAAGPGPRSVRLPGFPAFSPIICFESTFSGKMTDPADRPDVLVFITNDAWSFGTDGPQQHLGFARVRAIEEGLPILRAANTGLTSVIDSYGRIKEILPENTQGVIDAKIPEALPPTPFSAYKNLPAVLLSGILFLLGLIRKKI
jgi:apolipoprotein N-acyltransferase